MSSLRFSSIVGLAICVAVLMRTNLVLAQASAPDPNAVLKDAAAALAKHQAFRLEVSVVYQGKFQGSEEEIPTSFTIALQRPDQISIHIDNPETDMFIYGDGKEFTRYIPYYKQFVTDPQKMSTQELVVQSGFALIMPALNVVAELTSKDPFSGAMAPQSLKLVGQEDVNGHPCDRVHFTTAERGYDVWVETAPARLVRRVEPEMTPEETKLSSEYGTPFDLTVTASFDKWDFESDVAGLVKFTAPEGAMKVSGFMPPREKSEAEKMAGSPAPDFTLPLLAGGEMSLAKEKGNVVILDFWATWCVPCRVGLPVMQQLAGEYASKGVKVFAVNLGEEVDSVKGFLTQSGLEKLVILLDTDTSVKELFHADGIPQTVIIGKDGVIHSVHVGIPIDPAMPDGAVSPEEVDALRREGYAKLLRAELDALIETGAPPAK